MGDQFEEGWFTDPYARHEARWLSDGKPTKLVRDGTVESYDDPPEGDPVVEPVRIAEEGPPGHDELLRAEDAWGVRGPPEAGIIPVDPPDPV
jgi:hypothetical protein